MCVLVWKNLVCLFCVEFNEIGSKSINHRGFETAKTQQGKDRNHFVLASQRKITCNLTIGYSKKPEHNRLPLGKDKNRSTLALAFSHHLHSWRKITRNKKINVCGHTRKNPANGLLFSYNATDWSESKLTFLYHTSENHTEIPKEKTNFRSTKTTKYPSFYVAFFKFYLIHFNHHFIMLTCIDIITYFLVQMWSQFT